MVRKVLRWFTFLIAAAVGLSSAVVWVRSYSTFDLFAWSGNTALWPDGKTTAVPRGSDLVGRWWYREGKYPVMRIGGLQIRLAAGKVRVVRVLNNFRMDD